MSSASVSHLWRNTPEGLNRVGFLTGGVLLPLLWDDQPCEEELPLPGLNATGAFLLRDPKSTTGPTPRCAAVGFFVVLDGGRGPD